MRKHTAQKFRHRFGQYRFHVKEQPLPLSEPVHCEKMRKQGWRRVDHAGKPSKQMRIEAAGAGRCTPKLWHDKDYARIQILTVEGLLNRTERVDAPPQLNPFAMAARESAREKQTEML